MRCRSVGRTVLVLAIGLASPQVAAAQRPTIGVWGGLVATQTAAERLGADTAALPGGAIGGSVAFALGSRLTVSAEPGVSFVRARFQHNIEDRLTYLDVPVVAHYRVFGAPGGRVISAQAGAVMSRLLRATEAVSTESFDIFDALEPTHLGALVGGTVTLTERLSVGARYIHGLSDIYHLDGDRTTGRHRTVMVTAQYALTGGGR